MTNIGNIIAFKSLVMAISKDTGIDPIIIGLILFIILFIVMFIYAFLRECFKNDKKE